MNLRAFPMAACVLVLAEEVHEVREVHVDHRAHRGEERDADVRADRPVEHPCPERAALRDECDVARGRLHGEERGVEADTGPDDAETVGPDDAHRGVLEDRLDALLEREAGLACLAEARRHDDGPTRPGLRALEQDVGHRRRRSRHEDEVDRFRDGTYAR
jgi:hypothetical protein